MRLRRSETVYEFWALATYNAERSRGIVHAEHWQALMAREQARFNAGEPSRFEAERWLRVPRDSGK